MLAFTGDPEDYDDWGERLLDDWEANKATKYPAEAFFSKSGVQLKEVRKLRNKKYI